MNDLVQLKNEQAVCDSLQVAEKFGKRHADVIRAIDNLINNDSTQNCVKCFKSTSYTDNTGKRNKMFLMNRDGFTFLVMGFTGKKANEWKWKYIEAFNSMENIIKERNTEAWLEARKTGKLTRRSETDVLKQLVEYAKQQGSTHADMLYMTYSKLAKTMAGVKSREEASTKQLNDLDMFENIILHMVRAGIIENLGYKDIYKSCKQRIEAVKGLAFLGV